MSSSLEGLTQPAPDEKKRSTTERLESGLSNTLTPEEVGSLEGLTAPGASVEAGLPPQISPSERMRRLRQPQIRARAAVPGAPEGGRGISPLQARSEAVALAKASVQQDPDTQKLRFMDRNEFTRFVAKSQGVFFQGSIEPEDPTGLGLPPRQPSIDAITVEQLEARFAASPATALTETVVQFAFSRALGQPVETRTNPATGLVEYKSPALGGQWALANEPWLTAADFPGHTGDAMSIIGDILGAVGGGFAGAKTGIGIPLGVVLGSSFGAALGEFGRLQYAKSRGFPDVENLTNAQMATRAALYAGLPAATGALLLPGMMRFGRRFARAEGRFLPFRPDQEITEAFAKARGDAEYLATDLRRLFPDRFDDQLPRSRISVLNEDGKAMDLFTTGQLAAADPTNPAGSIIWSIERDLLKRDLGTHGPRRLLNDQQALNSYLLRRLVEPLNLPAGSEARAFAPLGASFREELYRVLSRQSARTPAQNAEILTRAKVSGYELIGSIRSGSMESLGRNLNVALEPQRVAFARIASEKYGAMHALVEALPRRINPNIGMGISAKRLGVTLARLEQNSFKSLQEIDRTVLNEFIERFGQKRTALGRFAKQETLTVEEFGATLSAVRSLRRAIDDGLAGNLEKKTVNEMIEALEVARSRWLVDKPEIATAWFEADAFVRGMHDTFDRSVVGEIMGKKVSGAEKILDEKVFARLSRPESAAENRMVAGLIKNPIEPLHGEALRTAEDAFSAMKNGWLDKYAREVLEQSGPKQGLVRSMRIHREFLRKHGDSMRPWIGDDGLRKIDKVGGYNLLLEKSKEEFEQFTKWALRQPGASSFGITADDLTNGTLSQSNIASKAQDVFENLWGTSGTSENFETVVGMIQTFDDSASWMRRLRGTVHQQMMKEMENTDRAVPQLWDFRKLIDIVGDPEKARKLEVVFGADYVRGLNTISRVVSIQSSVPLHPVTFETTRHWSWHLIKAVTGQFTTEGRSLTAAKMLQTSVASRELTKMMVDPGYMAEVMAVWTERPFEAGVLRLLGSAIFPIASLAAAPELFDENVAEAEKRRRDIAVGEAQRLGLSKQEAQELIANEPTLEKELITKHLASSKKRTGQAIDILSQGLGLSEPDRGRSKTNAFRSLQFDERQRGLDLGEN